jgi:hypothetical protein
VRWFASSLPLFAGLVLLGCAGRQNFTPTDNATSLSPAGYLASDYDVNSRLGAFSDAKVWSRGAYSQKIAGEKRTVVHVGFELENHLNQPIAFDAKGVRLDKVATDKHELSEEIAPSLVQGSPTLDAQDTRRLDVYFVLPGGVKPGDVDGFRVRWALTDGLQQYSQRTPFLKDEGIDYGATSGVTSLEDSPDRLNYRDRSEIAPSGPSSVGAPIGGPGLP